MTYHDLTKQYNNETDSTKQHKLLIEHKDVLIYQSAIMQQKEIAEDLNIAKSKLSNTLQILKAL